MADREKKRLKMEPSKPHLVSECSVSRLVSPFLCCTDVVHLACACRELLRALHRTPIDASHRELTLHQVARYFDPRSSNWSLVGAFLVGDQLGQLQSPPMPQEILLRNLKIRDVQTAVALRTLNLDRLGTLNVLAIRRLASHADWLVSALGKCSNLHTLNLGRCRQLTDISPLASCSSLHT